MKRLVLILICLTQIALAQNKQKPIYAEIAAVTTKDDNNNYNKLLRRLQDNDTTLSPDHYYVLYYGQCLQDNYSPYSISNQHLMELLKNGHKEEFIPQAKEHLKQKPFDLQTRNYLLQVLYEQRDTTNYQIYKHSLSGFIGTLLKSGSGKDSEDAIHVMSVSDEYLILRFLGLNIKNQRVKGICDVFELEKNTYNLDNFYFDVSKIFESRAKLFK